MFKTQAFTQISQAVSHAEDVGSHTTDNLLKGFDFPIHTFQAFVILNNSTGTVAWSL